MFIKYRFRPLQLLAWLAKVLALLGLPACATHTLQAETYFTGAYQQIAVAMNQGRLDDIPSMAKGLDLDAAGTQDMTLLWYAISTKNYPAITLLIRLGSQPDAQIAKGIGSALDGAFLSKDTLALQAMLDGSLSPDHRSPRHKLMLQRAVVDGTAEHVKLLVNRHADLNQSTQIGSTGLDESINTMQPEIAAYLIEHGANVIAYRTNGATPPGAYSA